MPPAEVLPSAISALSSYQPLEIRGDYWDHDVKLLTQQLHSTITADADDLAFDPYPAPPATETISSIDPEQLKAALAGPLKAWRVLSSPLPENTAKTREELFREYKFRAFVDAIGFMFMVAKGCDILNHHPRWENIWKTLRVYLTTWNIEHRISDRDIQLAKYFDAAYEDFMKRRSGD
jgi:pterin-4a-carbinolamine dehydratase